MRSLITLLLLTSVCAGQTSDGLSALPSKIVISAVNSDCSMSDIASEFINERTSTCGQGQTGFFNGEVRFVDSGEGVYGLTTSYNGYELTSCACSQNATWTRTMLNSFIGSDIQIRWTWKFYARRNDCSLELKRDLIALGCSYPTQCTCPEGLICGTDKLPEEEECVPLTPIAIDLDGDGLWLTGRAGGVNFDLDANGVSGPVPWLKEDGWLVLNDRQDGMIRDGRQLFGNLSAQAQLHEGELPNGYAALRVFDDDNNLYIDHRDGVWQLLGVWRDVNHNGISDRGEVISLTMIGITAIDLNYRESQRRDRYGNQLRYRSRVEWASGRKSWSWDVILTAE